MLNSPVRCLQSVSKGVVPEDGRTGFDARFGRCRASRRGWGARWGARWRACRAMLPRLCARASASCPSCCPGGAPTERAHRCAARLMRARAAFGQRSKFHLRQTSRLLLSMAPLAPGHAPGQRGRIFLMGGLALARPALPVSQMSSVCLVVSGPLQGWPPPSQASLLFGVVGDASVCAPACGSSMPEAVFAIL